MEQITTIGLDLAKQVFQVHAADADGVPIFNRKLRRAKCCGSSRRSSWSASPRPNNRPPSMSA